MKILAIDPGYEKSAWILYDLPTDHIDSFGIDYNSVLIIELREWSEKAEIYFTIEMVECMGMAVGKEVFETVFWIGRFYEAWGVQGFSKLISRRKVKMHLCGTMRAKDANIRQVLIDRFGPGKERAIGKKKTPGRLYGIHKDLWAALALAVTLKDTL